MRKNSFLFSMCLLAFSAIPSGSRAQWQTPVSQMEKLGRGVVAVKDGKSSTGNFVSWRLLGTDDKNVTFNVLRDGNVVKEGIDKVTYYLDNISGVHTYQVQTVLNGNVIETSPEVKSVDNYFLQLHLDRPASGVTPSGESYNYSPNDCSVGDVDGDGEYELIVKWDPSNSHDNSQAGYTGNVYLDCYKLDGTKLWRVDLGKNIRAGAHYTQFLVYDFDGDGKAEMICKTAAGSKDGTGAYVSEAADDDAIKKVNNNKDWRGSSSKSLGKVTGGQEWLTVFNGETGKAIHTIYYNPNRNGGIGGEAGWTKNWDDRSGKTDKEYGNRGERYLATVAYLAGKDKNPSAVMGRGYYTYAYLWAVDFDGSKLKQRWLHASVSKNQVEVTDADGNKTTTTYSKNTSGNGKSCTLYANGNHNLSCADVDGDGKDEIIYGSAAVDDDGSLLYAVGFGHGDAMHLSDLMPDRPGLEVFDVHEESPYGWDLHDAATGEVIYSSTGSNDNGRGLAADIYPTNRGFEFWSSNDRTPRKASDGATLSGAKSQSINFRAYWGGALYDDLLDGTNLKNYKGTAYKIQRNNVLSLGYSGSCNTTKATPNLSADIFGDWREEVILWNTKDSCTLNIFTSTEPTQYRIPTLMHDHTYRMGISWQNTAYNQPPHLGFYLPDYVKEVETGIKNVESNMNGFALVTVYDVNGRTCWSGKVEDVEQFELPTSLSDGIYVVKLVQGRNVQVRKVVK